MKIKTWLRGLVLALLDYLSEAQLHDLVADTLRSRCGRLEPENGLRFLFKVEDVLRNEQDIQAIRYEGSLHPKHRLTMYHDFFVARVRRGERVLDVGCGCGVVARELAVRAGARVTAIDLDPGNIRRAELDFSHPDVEYRVGDVTSDLPDTGFDVVLLSNVLEHIENREYVLDMLARVVRPRCLLIRVPVFERDWRVAMRRELGCRWKLDSTHEIEYTAETFAEEMIGAGLTVEFLEYRWGEIWAQARPLDTGEV